MENWTPNRRSRLVKTFGLSGLSAVAALALQAPVEGRQSPSEHITTSPVYWMGDIVGSSTLVRTRNGISFTYHTSGLDAAAGQVITLWIVVFNHPEECATSPCTDADLFNPKVQGDFLLGAGHVIGGSGLVNFGGHLRAGDISQSGLAEAALGPAVGLLPELTFTAEIQMAIHSHGPAVPGEILKAQLSSFLGGCHGGLDDFVVEPDFPDEVGECLTFQSSIHQP
jgi:hypothetical protein